MILLSRVLKYKLNRTLNIIAGFLLVTIQVASLMVDVNTLHYCFFSIIEIATCLGIIWIAWKWTNSD
jgi:hypothetical protein